MSDLRTEFSAKTKLARWQHCRGFCEGKDCGLKLWPGDFDYDHDISCENGGDNTFENCRVLCKPCHKFKTGQHDMPITKKVRRLERKEAGIRPKSKFACSRDGKWKKTISGQVVPR